MMKRRRWLLAATAGVLALLIAGGAAFAALRGDRDGITRKQVLTFVSVVVAEDFLDVGEPAQEPDFQPSPGDSFFFHDELWNRAETARRGDIHGKCTFGVHGAANCAATVFLAGGTIHLAAGFESLEEEAATIIVAVTGGTERYKNVVGQATIVENFQGEEGKSLVRIELIPSFQRP